ncbi:hypothetical protein AB0I22_21045 [Streptomyces sp. NPDC050610]
MKADEGEEPVFHAASSASVSSLIAPSKEFPSEGKRHWATFKEMPP